MSALSHTLVPIRDVVAGDVFVDSAWKDSALWGQTVEAVSFVSDALTDRVGRLVQLRLSGSCGLSTRETTIVEVLR